jgi:hypothetical protein
MSRSDMDNSQFDWTKLGSLPAFQNWLSSKTNNELLDLLYAITLELRSRRFSDTTTRVSVLSKPLQFRSVSEVAISKFTRVPLKSGAAEKGTARQGWRMVWISSNSDHPPIAMEVIDEIVIGRSAEDFKPDLDLGIYDALELGVSRRHARLRPTQDLLLVYDLNSANGTFRNGERIAPNTPQVLGHGDVLSFSKLHFKIKFIGK